MRAAQINSYGGKDVVSINPDAPKPTLAEGQVLVDVYAASVNPFDLTVREGRAQQMARLEFPATLGGDVAGVVAEISDSVTGLTVGQAVYGQAGAISGQGSFAEFTPVKAGQLASKPQSIDFTTAAALPLTGVSAYQALVDHMSLIKGQKILIHGGAGGIGTMAIQLAKHLGAYVATTASKDDTGYVKGLGADLVVDYTSQDFSIILKDYDAVLDTVGGETNLKSYKVLKPGGILVSTVAQPAEELIKQRSIHYELQFTRVNPERLTEVAKLVDAGALKIHIDKVFPLEEAAEALEYLKTGHTRGKVVIKIKG